MDASIPFIVSSSWEADPGSDLKETISVSVVPNDNSSQTISHEICEDSYIFLRNPDSRPCLIDVTLEDVMYRVSYISVVSEARLIEVYGRFGEYIRTIECSPLSDHANESQNTTKYYFGECEISTFKDVGLKFAGLKNRTEMWLCGIKLLLTQTNRPLTHVNYANVDERLKNVKTPLSEKAEKCKQFLQSYSAMLNRDSNIPSKYPDPQGLLNLLLSDYTSQKNPLGDAAKMLCKLPEFFNKTSGKEAEVETKTDLSEIQLYINKKVDELEKKIMYNVERQIRELEIKQNLKLDAILQLLSKKTTANT